MNGSDKSPEWIRTLKAWLPMRPQFVVAGNTADLWPNPSLADGSSGPLLVRLSDLLHAHLADRLPGAWYLRFDGIDGVRWIAQAGDVAPIDVDPINQALAQDGWHGALRDLISSVTGCPSAQLVLIVDYASRLPRPQGQLGDEDREFFMFAEKTARTAMRIPKSQGAMATYNPVFWVCDSERDLPPWFAGANPQVGVLTIPLPGEDQRFEAAAVILRGRYPEAEEQTPALFEASVKSLTERSSGLTTEAAFEVVETLPLGEAPDDDTIGAAIRAYKYGFRDNPWKQEQVRNKVREWEATDELGRQVLGQETAVTRALDILKRSVLGLSGAHVSAASARPKGVMFFAGPTGVGKTELAKQMTGLIYGWERKPLRFDMSEFSDEYSANRLIGAPPGYIGHDAGGELTDAVRREPFSLLLFDEIEKAHPRVLDKFLQILDDGRLTDSRGNTAYFSETLIVFTSNLGITRVEPVPGSDHLTRTKILAKPGDPVDEVEATIREEIDRVFERDMRRPELRGRLGDNIVVFGFIRPEVAPLILEKFLRQVKERVKLELGSELTIAPKAAQTLTRLCTADLSKGGRGIGNALEATFINPLARALFDSHVRGGAIHVRDVVERAMEGDRPVYEVVLEA